MVARFAGLVKPYQDVFSIIISDEVLGGEVLGTATGTRDSRFRQLSVLFISVIQRTYTIANVGDYIALGTWGQGESRNKSSLMVDLRSGRGEELSP
jgi:hypothetical protein